MYLNFLTTGGYATQTSTSQANAFSSPIFTAILIGTAVGLIIFSFIAKVIMPQSEVKDEKHYLQGIYRLLAVICLFIIISVSIGIAMAISMFI